MNTELLPERLMETALGLFSASSFDEVELVDIARAVGCPTDDLYRNFPRKESFILRLYERMAAELEEVVTLRPPTPLWVRVRQ
ncbi:MAG: TetR/AcrR family transcriptional regulator [Pirellulaceae bacterium]|nr:TetR/AcrR family transcriptional regulator [Pirellulaceae bacterium]